jgi:hypothetical protein
LTLCLGLAVGLVGGAFARRPLVSYLANAVMGAWLLVGLQQVLHVPYTSDAAGAVSERGPAPILEALGAERLPLWRLDPWATPPQRLRTAHRTDYLAAPSPHQLDAARQAERYVAAVPGDILGEEMDFTVTTGRRIYVQPFEFSQQARQGWWDQGPLLEDIRRGHFGVVVLHFRLGDDPYWRRERINDEMIAALSGAYELDATYGEYHLYRPREPGGGAD